MGNTSTGVSAHNIQCTSAAEHFGNEHKTSVSLSFYTPLNRSRIYILFRPECFISTCAIGRSKSVQHSRTHTLVYRDVCVCVYIPNTIYNTWIPTHENKREKQGFVPKSPTVYPRIKRKTTFISYTFLVRLRRVFKTLRLTRRLCAIYKCLYT